VGFLYLLAPGIASPPFSGSLLMALSGIAWGGYSLLGRSASDPIQATAGNFLRAAPLALIAGLALLPSLSLSPVGLFSAVLSGAIASGLGYVVWYAALKSLTAAQAATVQLSVPVIAAFGGVFLLSEDIAPRLSISAGIILGGIALSLLPPMKSARVARTGKHSAVTTSPSGAHAVAKWT
jgi:drug/metabolite transporter (DMT)-like permease